MPAAVVASVATQLGIHGDTDLAPYRDGEARWDHAADIRKRYGYRDFGEQPEHFKLVRWLYTRAWLSTERPSILFDLATAWLIERKILLPGVSILARLTPACGIGQRYACGTPCQLPPAKSNARVWTVSAVR